MSSNVRRIRALIVDDEPLARRNLAVLLVRDADIELLGECGAASRAVERIQADRPQSHSRRLAIRRATGIEFITLAAIDWVEAADYYSCVHVGARTHLLRRSLATLAGELDPAVFVRIHRSTLVNVARVRALQLNTAGEYDVVLVDGTRLRLSRRYRKEVLQRLSARAV